MKQRIIEIPPLAGEAKRPKTLIALSDLKGDGIPIGGYTARINDVIEFPINLDGVLFTQQGRTGGTQRLIVVTRNGRSDYFSLDVLSRRDVNGNPAKNAFAKEMAGFDSDEARVINLCGKTIKCTDVVTMEMYDYVNGVRTENVIRRNVPVFKYVDSSNSPQTITYKDYIEAIQSSSSWQGFKYKEDFISFFFEDDNAKSLYETLYLTYRNHYSPEMDIIKALNGKTFPLEKADRVFDLFKKACLYNPFSVLRGTPKLIILPFAEWGLPSTSNETAFRSLKYSNRNHYDLGFGINLARKIKTFLDVQDIGNRFRLELSPSRLRSQYDYKWSYDVVRHVLTVGYGVPIINDIYNARDLLGRIRQQLEEYRIELFKDCPKDVAWNIFEHYRTELCNHCVHQQRYDFSRVANSQRYPFYFSNRYLNDCIFFEKGLPFKILQ